MSSASRATKIADKLGIQNRTELVALQNFVANQETGDGDQVLKLPGSKINKIQSKFGEERAVEYVMGSNNTLDPKDSYKSKLKKTRRLSFSEELLSSVRDMSLDNLSPDTDRAESKKSQNQLSDEDEKQSKLAGLAGPVQAEEQEPTVRPSVAVVVTPSTSSMDRRVRTGKLLDFFGVQDDTHVGDIRRLADKTRENENRSRVPTCLLRIHFANRTHMIVATPIQSSALDIQASVLRKLQIKEDSNEYGLFERREDAERCMDPGERVFDAVRQWTGNEYIVFKRKNRACSENNVSLSDSQLGDDDGANENMANPASSKARKVAKLAMFFGVSTDNTVIKQEQDELEEILEMLKEGQEMPIDDTVMNELENWKSGVLRIDTIVNEGWLEVRDRETKELRDAWVSLEKGSLLLRFSDSRDVAISQGDPTSRTPLQNASVELDPSQQNGFLLRSKTSDKHVIYRFVASSEQSADDWVSCIKEVIKQQRDTVGTESQISSLQKTSFSTREGRKGGRRVTIDDFEFHRVLGKGKYGTVLLCSHRTTKKVFAIKVLQKDKDSKDSAKTESEILRIIRHPFIVGLHYALQNQERMYLVMEYVNGGELFFHLSQQGKFPEARAKFYGAEILLALQCLHGKGIVYRDLKLENILLDKDGHIKIADFGLSSMEAADKKTFTVAGTAEYFAPEVIKNQGCSFPADWWAFGIILFELMCGYHPFYNPDQATLYKLILYSRLEYPAHLSSKAIDLISKLLEREPTKRLGSGKHGSRDIQTHAFFRDIDFIKLFHKEIPTPWRPDVDNDFDVKFFDSEFTSEMVVEEHILGSNLITDDDDDNDEVETEDKYVPGFAYRASISTTTLE
ncbi:hypothetical protein RI367_004792 [Sorochytrium milnesiophthora]